ncbi:hypothetical protein SALBM135S_03043 [Streptomyces alboniger]
MLHGLRPGGSGTRIDGRLRGLRLSLNGRLRLRLRLPGEGRLRLGLLRNRRLLRLRRLGKPVPTSLYGRVTGTRRLREPVPGRRRRRSGPGLREPVGPVRPLLRYGRRLPSAGRGGLRGLRLNGCLRLRLRHRLGLRRQGRGVRLRLRGRGLGLRLRGLGHGRGGRILGLHGLRGVGRRGLDGRLSLHRKCGLNGRFLYGGLGLNRRLGLDRRWGLRGRGPLRCGGRSRGLIGGRQRRKPTLRGDRRRGPGGRHGALLAATAAVAAT